MFIIAGALARYFRKFRLVTHIRVLTTVFPKPLYKLWFGLNKAKSDQLCTVSFVCKEDIERLAGPQQSLEVVYDFILPEEHQPPFAISRQSPYRLLFVGNYTRGKGHDIAIAAVATLKALAPDLPVVLNVYGSDFGHAGNILYRKELSAQIEALGLQDSVQLHDFARDLESVYKSHDVLLNLSVAESFSFVVAEAMSYGIPVIATNSGGPSELLDGGKVGSLVSSDADAIAQELHRLLSDAALRSHRSAAAKARITGLIGQYGGVGRYEKLLTGASGQSSLTGSE